MPLSSGVSHSIVSQCARPLASPSRSRQHSVMLSEWSERQSGEIGQAADDHDDPYQEADPHWPCGRLRGPAILDGEAASLQWHSIGEAARHLTKEASCKAGDSNALIADLDARGAKVVISQHPRRASPLPIDLIYKWRHLIENFFCKLKEFKRIAMRSDKTDQSFSAMIHLAAGPRLSHSFDK
jgi:hypothetical protein